MIDFRTAKDAILAVDDESEEKVRVSLTNVNDAAPPSRFFPRSKRPCNLSRSNFQGDSIVHCTKAGSLAIFKRQRAG